MPSTSARCLVQKLQIRQLQYFFIFQLRREWVISCLFLIHVYKYKNYPLDTFFYNQWDTILIKLLMGYSYQL